MSTLFGALGLDDNERATIGAIGQGLVFDAINAVFEEHNADVEKLLSVFVEKQTENYTERYLLPGGGKLQLLADQAPSAAVKRSGYWDVAYPLRGWGAALAGSRVSLAYMTVQELDAHLKTILAQDLYTLRWRVLTALFEDTNLTFADPIWGNLTIRRLANGDGTLYPPVTGSETEEEENHYLYTGYDVADIDASNNPAATVRADLEHHFGGRGTYGDNVVLFHHSEATPYFAAISGYAPVDDKYVQLGDDTARAIGIPNVPGRVHGRLTGCWLSEWAAIPSLHYIGLHLDAPRPLVMRVDPASTGLGRGLHLVQVDREYPLQSAYYERRFGLGCGNRLSACAVEVSELGSYTPPTGYAE